VRKGPNPKNNLEDKAWDVLFALAHCSVLGHRAASMRRNCMKKKDDHHHGRCRDLLLEGLETITAKNTAAWFRHCGIWDAATLVSL
jgi:hypothetical protein